MTYFDTLIIGAGISGISAAHYMQTDCPNKTYAILEGRKRIGGTWDLFRYPGIRSDSDMYTFGFAFRPWTSNKAIASRELIIDYLKSTVKEEGIDQHILFEHHVNKASWSSETGRWTVSVAVPHTEEVQVFTCSFLSLCTGYYDYEKGYTPEFKDRDKFKGRIIHPQSWTSDIEYADKKVIVIGSGATAVTLIPSLAEEAKHITMLQRSPTYIAARPAVDKKAVFLNKLLPAKLAHSINRWRQIRRTRLVYYLCTQYPNWMKGVLIKGVEKLLGKDYDIKTHFTPVYKPWDQRLCLAPDGDFFETINSGKATIVTDHIDTFTEKGIRLKSGETLDADLIVTATGLNATVISNFPLEVDGELVDFSEKVSYRAALYSDIPNLSVAFGYTNASWTLKVDLVNQYVCRLINYMDEKGYKQCCPRQNDPNLELLPAFDFTPGYIMRVLDKLPKTGAKEPWKLKQNYFYDKKVLKSKDLNDGILEFK